MIGTLLYTANRTRPDISYVVGRLSRYTSNHISEHCTALERIFRYIVGIIDYALFYSGHPNIVEGYCDENWVTDYVDVNGS